MKKFIPLLIIPLILPLFVPLIFPFNAHAQGIIDGDLIRATNAFDVYIVKLIDADKFKRLILNPEIFNQYSHLKWENIKTVSQVELDEYETSDLVRTAGDEKVYKLYPNGDTGEKRWIKTAEDFSGFGYKVSSIYEINSFERDFYTTGAELTYRAPETPETPTIPPRTENITIKVPADYSTIQAAIDVAIDGDTIAVDLGTYKENIVINKDIKLITSYTGTVIDGDGKGPAVTISGADDFMIQRFMIKSKDEKAIYCSGANLSKGKFKNITLKDSGWGIYLDGNCNITILNNLIYNNRNSSNNDGAGILVKNNASYNFVLEIINNTIDDNYRGVWSDNANLKVMNSIIASNAGGNDSTGVYHSGSGEIITMYNNVWSNAINYGGDAVAGSGSWTVYPEFANKSARDYRLTWGVTVYSKCIDAGNSDYIYNDGKLFTSNIYRNDMGAYGGPDNIGWTP